MTSNGHDGSRNARSRPDAADRCPCLSGEVYGGCCGPILDGTLVAPTATRLMRSRFTAFAIGGAEHLLATWHPRTRPDALDLDPDVRWYRLDIESSIAGGPLDSEGTVAFTARYRSPDGPGSQHETSRFVRARGRWLYLEAH